VAILKQKWKDGEASALALPVLFCIRDCSGKPAGTRTCNGKPGPKAMPKSLLNEFGC